MAVENDEESPQDVDRYIEAAPIDVRAKLTQLRKVIKATAPKAEERISWNMPHYSYQGQLAGFAVFKKHISLFVMPPVINDHKEELSSYTTTKAAIHFPFDKPLPVALIKKLVKARIKINKAGKEKPIAKG